MNEHKGSKQTNERFEEQSNEMGILKRCIADKWKCQCTKWRKWRNWSKWRKCNESKHKTHVKEKRQNQK